MQLISLFSGIGGFELAATWANWEIISSCEINPFGMQVLKHYWPQAYHHDDIKTLTRETITQNTNWNPSKSTIVVGGFPCQPYSLAGKRLGKEDDRHLWPEMLRIIREVSPEWVVGENVLGLINWSGGLVFDEVQTDLEAAGYEVQPYELPACGVNAPHRRGRVWFVALRITTDPTSPRREERKQIGGWKDTAQNGTRMELWDQRHGNNGITPYPNERSERSPGESYRPCECRSNNNAESKEWREQTKLDTRCSDVSTTPPNPSCFRCNDGSDNREERHLQTDKRTATKDQSKRERRECRIGKVSAIDANTDNKGPQRSKEQGSTSRGREERNKQPSLFFQPNWNEFPTQSPIRGRNDGFSPTLVGITLSKHRNESIKAYGNAIVPQVAYQIFNTINQYIEQCQHSQNQIQNLKY